MRKGLLAVLRASNPLKKGVQSAGSFICLILQLAGGYPKSNFSYSLEDDAASAGIKSGSLKKM